MDPAALLKLQHLSPGAMQRIIDSFFADAPIKIRALRAGLAGRDGEAASMAAHTLKGGCGYVGALRLYELCEEVEAEIAAGDFDAAAQNADRIDREVSVLRRSIDQEIVRPDFSTP